MFDYKSIIRNRSTRLKLLKMADIVPDKLMVKIQYKLQTGNRLNIVNPKRFTEKMQWYKLYYRDPLMKRCVDKYEVRDYVKECGYDNILVPIFGVYDSVDEIDFNVLPDRYVIKNTLGGGGNNVLVVDNKNFLDKNLIISELKKWDLNNKGKSPGREWVYEGRPGRIIIESFLDSDPGSGGLIDYKFFCFNGNVKFVFGMADRVLGGEAGLGIFSSDFKLLPVSRIDSHPLERKLEKPKNYNEMIQIAETLSRPFPEARIDLYNVDGNIFFGEITFFSASGYMRFDPDDFDYTIGKEFIIPGLD